MILPLRKELDKSKQLDRKREIDNGLALAKQVDGLRETFAQEKLIHSRWKEESTKELQRILQELDGDIVSKKNELGSIAEQRTKLLKPLDEEWSTLNKNKEQVVEQQKELYLDQERFKEELKLLEAEKEQVKLIIQRITKNEKDTEKSKSNAKSLEEMAQHEYERACELTKRNSIEYERRIDEINQRAKEYEVALATIKVKEKQIEEKEIDIINREILLKDRYEMLERTLKRK